MPSQNKKQISFKKLKRSFTIQNSESTIANLRARLANAEGNLVKASAEKTLMEGDFQAMRLEVGRLSNLAECEQQLTKQSAESSEQWEAQARLSDDKVRALQEEIISP